MALNNPSTNSLPGLQLLLDRKGKSALADNNVGYYAPVLKQEALESSTGLSNHASGGVVATTAGATGTGAIYTSKPIDPSLPFKGAIIIEVNDANLINELHIADAANLFYTGLRFTSISTAGITGTVGGVSAFSYGTTSGIPAGTKLWITIASDGLTNVHVAIVPFTGVTAFGFDSAITNQVTFDGTAYTRSSALTTQNSGHFVFGQTTGAESAYRLCRLQISTQSTQNRVIGFYMSQTLNNPTDGLLNPPTLFQTKIGNDSTAWFIIPGKQGSAPVDAVMVLHPNGNTGYYGLAGIGNPSEITKMYNAGYALFGITGANIAGDFSGASSSNWGSGAGLRYRKLQWDYLTSNISGIRWLNLFGMSMGGQNSLAFLRGYTLPIKSIILVSAAVDLTDSYVNRSFKTIIDPAYAPWYQSINALTGVYPDQTVSVTATAAVGATSITVAALTYAIPSGTTLTFQSGTASQTTIVTTAAAAANATSIAVTVTTATISSGAAYNMTFHWARISYGYGAPDDSYFQFSWKNVFAAATAYTANDIVAQPLRAITTLTAANSAKFYAQFDPVLNVNTLQGMPPIFATHGDADALIPAAQVLGLQTKYIAIGGVMTVNIIPGGTHLGSTVFTGTDWVNFLALYNK